MVSKITSEELINPAPTTSSWKEKTIPFLGGRPKRESVIDSDDVMNLIIAFNTCRTLEEFLQLT